MALRLWLVMGLVFSSAVPSLASRSVTGLILFCPVSNGALGCQVMDRRRVGVSTCGDRGFYLYKKVRTEHGYPMWIRGRLEVRC